MPRCATSTALAIGFVLSVASARKTNGQRHRLRCRVSHGYLWRDGRKHEKLEVVPARIRRTLFSYPLPPSFRARARARARSGFFSTRAKYNFYVLALDNNVLHNTVHSDIFDTRHVRFSESPL